MDWHASLTPGRPAPYGYACANCAHSKCKCIVRCPGEPCERCHRSNKECRQAKTVRRRNPRRPAVSKTARLKEKLDSIVSLIKAGGAADAVVTPPLDTSIQINSNTCHQSRRGSALSLHNAPILTPTRTDSSGSPSDLPYSGYTGEPSLLEADEYLISFQTYKLRYFPFVDIPSTVTAQQLRQERPFLWLCVMALGSRSTSQQQALGNKIRQTIAEEMVLRSEKNIDLLLGLLAYIGWANYQLSTKTFLCVFTQRAVSLVFDIGLNKPVPKDTPAMPCRKQHNTRPPNPQDDGGGKSCVWMLSGNINTSHMNECLQMLDEKKECSNDEILVNQVRLQLIVENLRDGFMESPEHRSPSLNLHSQLQEIKAGILLESQGSDVLLLHIYGIEMEIILSPTFLHGLRTNQLTFQQLQILNTGLESIKSWFDMFFTTPPTAYIGFPFSIFLQLIRYLMTLYRITNLNDPAWRENCILKAEDLLLILDRVINNMKRVATLAELDNSDSPEGDLFSQSARTLHNLRSEWEPKLGPHYILPPAPPTPQNVNESALLDVFEEEYFDNDWFMDLLSPNFEASNMSSVVSCFLIEGLWKQIDVKYPS